MPLEQDLQAATTAMNRLSDNLEKYGPAIAGMGGAAAPAATDKPAATTKKKADAPASKYTPEQIHEYATKLKDAKGADAAKELIKQFGGGKLPDLKTQPDKFDAFVAAVEAAIGEDDDGL